MFASCKTKGEDARTVPCWLWFQFWYLHFILFEAHKSASRQPQTQMLTRHIAYTYIHIYLLYVCTQPVHLTASPFPSPLLRAMCATFKLAPECVKIIIPGSLTGPQHSLYYVYIYMYSPFDKGSLCASVICHNYSQRSPSSPDNWPNVSLSVLIIIHYNARGISSLDRFECFDSWHLMGIACHAN